MIAGAVAAEPDFTDLEQRRQDLQDRFGWKARIKASPHHHLDQAVDVAFVDASHPSVGAVTQHADAITDFKNLIQMVGDEYDCDTLTLELAHDLKQQVCLVWCQRGI